jgi:hypothetical protein
MWSSLQTASISKLFAIVFTLVFLVYLPSFGNSFLWDDEQFIVENLFTTSLSYLPQIFTTNTIEGAGHVSNYYRPLTTLSFTLDRLVWGLNPVGFHLTNTWLHAVVAGLLFLLMTRLGLGRLTSLSLSLLYGVHPLNTEAVTYINSRGDSLSAFFLMAGILSFDSALRGKPWYFSYDGHRYAIGGRWQWILAGVGFAAAVLAKEIAVAGIGIYFLFAGWHWLNRKIEFRKIGIFLASLSAILVSYFGLRLTVLNFSNSLNFYPYENEYTRSLAIRVFTFCRVWWEYLKLLVLPYPLHMERNVEFVTELSSPWVWTAVVVVALWTWLALWAGTRRHEWLIAFGSLWFVGMLVPVSGIVPINGIMYEHWLYLPMMGGLIALGGLWRLTVSLVPKARKVLPLVKGFWIFFLILFISLTVRQNWIWRHPIPFYTYTLQYAESARLYNNLAMAYADEGETLKSIEIYEQALTQSNVYPQIYYNLARSYRELGQVEAAIDSAEKAVEVDPSFLFARTLLIDMYTSVEQFSAALPHIQALVDVYPNDPILRQTLLDLQKSAAKNSQN